MTSRASSASDHSRATCRRAVFMPRHSVVWTR
jgi:hypothetical protein